MASVSYFLRSATNSMRLLWHKIRHSGQQLILLPMYTFSPSLIPFFAFILIIQHGYICHCHLFSRFKSICFSFHVEMPNSIFNSIESIDQWGETQSQTQIINTYAHNKFELIEIPIMPLTMKREFVKYIFIIIHSTALIYIYLYRSDKNRTLCIRVRVCNGLAIPKCNSVESIDWKGPTFKALMTRKRFP